MHKDLLSKLSQVIEQISRDVFYDFCCSYAESHEELAMALVNEFWRPEKNDYRSMVQQCLMHPTPSGIRNGDGYDWGAVAADLSQMMALADEKVKEGSLIDAAEIARYVMTLTCAEYEADHPYGETYGEVWWLRRKPLKEVLERARVMLTEWKMYDEALEVADNDNNIHASIYGYSKKTLAILDLMDDREKTIKVCKDRFCKSDRKQPYFDRLRQEMTKEEWDAFIDDTIRNADDVFQEDYNHVEPKGLLLCKVQKKR